MNPIRSQALKLRLRGKSYNEIVQELGVPKSTLYGWLSETILPDAAQVRLRNRVRQGTLNGLIKRNKLQTHTSQVRAHASRLEGVKSIHSLTKTDLLIAGAALYWAEGYKRLKIRNGKERMDHTVRFVNADPDMIRLFVRFVQEILDIPSKKIRLSMRLYPHINEKEALQFWMNVTQLPKSQFFKTTHLVSISSKGKRPFNRLPYGTLEVEICDTQKFHFLLGLIDGVKKAF